MVDIIGGYLTEYEADYIRFMSTPSQQHLAWPHRERNWPGLGDAAIDLIHLRKLLDAAVRNINQYAEKGSVLDWKEPQLLAARHWARYAGGRRLCPICGFDINYSYDDECPQCPNDKTVFRLTRTASQVSVAGSFSDWTSIEMNRSSYTEWVVRIKLTPDRYTYKFIVDGMWILDPNNPLNERDEHGNLNSVINVP
jgi:hypothetical protein